MDATCRCGNRGRVQTGPIIICDSSVNLLESPKAFETHYLRLTASHKTREDYGESRAPGKRDHMLRASL